MGYLKIPWIGPHFVVESGGSFLRGIYRRIRFDCYVPDPVRSPVDWLFLHPFDSRPGDKSSLWGKSPFRYSKICLKRLSDTIRSREIAERVCPIFLAKKHRGKKHPGIPENEKKKNFF